MEGGLDDFHTNYGGMYITLLKNSLPYKTYFFPGGTYVFFKVYSLNCG